MTIAGIPSGGFKTVGQIVGTNALRFHAKQSGMAIAADLLQAHLPGAPVVNDDGRFIGFVSEFDLLGAIESGTNLDTVTADQIMNPAHIGIQSSTTISDAIKLMKDQHLLILPVERDGKVTHSVTRHDLLRARIGFGVDIEE